MNYDKSAFIVDVKCMKNVKKNFVNNFTCEFRFSSVIACKDYIAEYYVQEENMIAILSVPAEPINELYIS